MTDPSTPQTRQEGTDGPQSAPQASGGPEPGRGGADAADGGEGARTHDYGPGRRCWGHDFTIVRVLDGGRVSAMGWGPILTPRIRTGDYLLLDNRGSATRYQVREIAYQMDPPDMWSACLDFAPRTADPKDPA
ncbi:hypothetical protein [Streptomyces sp. 184]|uniref:hypothetical protein n=1 Tax=Streptomyces sp. 184 TaxID=1827526 RepID=UPI0038929816